MVHRYGMYYVEGVEPSDPESKTKDPDLGSHKITTDPGGHLHSQTRRYIKNEFSQFV